MFYSLTGEIVYKDASSVAISCGGVAFRCSVTLTTLNELSDKKGAVTLFTYLSVRDDALELFGFYDESELDCFKMLISVSGVGPKAALAILSQLTPDRLALAVSAGDVKAITKAQGVGPKIAQRVVLELKDKMKTGPSSGTGENFAQSQMLLESNTAEAVEALVMLGYSQSEASAAVAKLDHSLSVEKLITQALKIL
ncbi:MAG: Holliday junction branch migration protein RuvA [Acutalibacteraceae bacterium]|nr:Holliday junction branch migration protein RuvA [Oscillospiraceae bacterium]